MENARYATNDDIAGLINPMENRNTSRKIKYDLKLIKNYLHHIPYGFWNRSALKNIKKDPLKYMINWANMGVSGWYGMWYKKCNVLIYKY
jgi:hypothetical protein